MSRCPTHGILGRGFDGSRNAGTRERKALGTRFLFHTLFGNPQLCGRHVEDLASRWLICRLDVHIFLAALAASDGRNEHRILRSTRQTIRGRRHTAGVAPLVCGPRCAFTHSWRDSIAMIACVSPARTSCCAVCECSSSASFRCPLAHTSLFSRRSCSRSSSFLMPGMEQIGSSFRTCIAHLNRYNATLMDCARRHLVVHVSRTPQPYETSRLRARLGWQHVRHRREPPTFTPVRIPRSAKRAPDDQRPCRVNRDEYAQRMLQSRQSRFAGGRRTKKRRQPPRPGAPCVLASSASISPISHPKKSEPGRLSSKGKPACSVHSPRRLQISRRSAGTDARRRKKEFHHGVLPRSKRRAHR